MHLDSAEDHNAVMDKPVYQQERPHLRGWSRKAMSVGGFVVGSVLLSILSDVLKPAFLWLLTSLYSGLILGIDVLAAVHYQSIGRMDTGAKAGLIAFDTLVVIGCLVMLLFVFILRTCERLVLRQQVVGRYFWQVLVFSIGMVFGIVSVSLAGSTVALNKRLEFNILERVAAPYLTGSERLLVDARLASIENRSDFEKLVIELDAVLRKNGVPTPKGLTILPRRSSAQPQNQNEAK